MSTNEEKQVLRYPELTYEWYVDNLPLTERILSTLFSPDVFDEFPRDWFLERLVIITTLKQTIIRYGYITCLVAGR
jgi:hypothetical protein